MTRTFNPKRLFDGAFIPNWLMRRTEVTTSAKLVYARLVQYCSEEGVAWPKIESLSEEVGLSVRQCGRVLAELKEIGLIESEQRGLGQSNCYTFIWHSWISDDEHRPDGHIGVSCHDVDGMTGHDVDGISLTNVRKEQKKRTIYITPIPNLVNQTGFEECWKSWQDHRREKKKPLTESTAKLQLKFLSTQPDPIACIEQSIFHGWEGLFAVKAPIQNPKQLTSKEISKLPNARDVRRVV